MRRNRAAWNAYSHSRKSPLTRKAGPGFADADYKIAIDWLAARDASRKRNGALPGRIAEADGYVGYMEPYATSHGALDDDRAFQQEVVNAAQALGKAVLLARLGRLDNPGAGLVEPEPK